MQYSTQPVKGDKTHFSNLYVASLSILTHIHTHTQTCWNVRTHTNYTTHRPFYLLKKCVSRCAESLIWTGGATAAPNLNATEAQFTSKITIGLQLMHWATKFKTLHRLSVGNCLSNWASRENWGSIWYRPVIPIPSFIMLFYHILVRRPVLLLCKLNISRICFRFKARVDNFF